MLCKLTRLSKKEYYSNYFNENFTNVRKTWEVIKRVSMGLTDRRKTAKNLVDSRKN